MSQPPWDSNPLLKDFLVSVIRRSLGISTVFLYRANKKYGDCDWQKPMIESVLSGISPLIAWIDAEVIKKDMCPICGEYKKLNPVAHDGYWNGKGYDRLCYTCFRSYEAPVKTH